MSCAFTIGGQDWSNYLDIKSIKVIDHVESRSDSMTFRLVVDSSGLSAAPGVPKAGQIVSMSVDGVKQFEGVIFTVDQDVHASIDNYSFNCSAGSYSFLLDANLVTEKFEVSQAAGVVVRYLVNKYAPGFGTRYVRDGFVVGEDEFEYVGLGSVLNKYAQATGFFWYVDFNREVHFQEGEATAGPATSINLDTNVQIGDVLITEDVTQIKNRIYVKDATVKSAESRTDTFIGDDSASFFNLFSLPYDIGEVFLNGESVTVYEDPLTTQIGELTGGGDNVAFWCVINGGIRFPEDNIPELGDQIEATYFPEEGGGADGIVLTLEDPDSIRMMRNREYTSGYHSDGVHEATLSVPDMRVASLDPLAFLGGIVLDRQAWPEISAEFVVSDPSFVGWKPGQVVRLSSSKRNLYSARHFWRTGARSSIEMHVQQVQKKYLPYQKDDLSIGTLIEERVSLSSIPARVTI